MRTAVVLLAAGSGRRAGGKTLKQLARVNGEPLFMRSVRVFSALPSVKEIVVVSQPENHAKMFAQLRRLRFRGLWKVVAGGTYRGASVRNGLKVVTSEPTVVMIHDTARALVSVDVVRRVERAARKHGAALAAWPLPDTLKKASPEGRVKKTIPRKDLWLAQTPQAFTWKVAKACLLRPSPTATDDAELVERTGRPVYVVTGAATNFKVTYPMDLHLCRLLAR